MKVFGLPDELVVKDTIGDVGFFRMKVFVVCSSNDSIWVHANTELFKHRVDVCALLLFATLAHHHEDTTTLINIPSDVLQFLRIERKSGSTQ